MAEARSWPLLVVFDSLLRSGVFMTVKLVAKPRYCALSKNRSTYLKNIGQMTEKETQMIARTLFSEEHEMLRASARRFMETEVMPHHARWEEQGYVDRALWRQAGQAGFLCASMPEQYGGAGADRLHSVVLIEEQARVGATGPGFGLHSEIVAPYILHYGSEYLKSHYLPKLASGEWIGAIAMTEPGTGSDLQGVQASAVRARDSDGDYYLLNGAKTFITNGWHADVVIVVAKTDPAAGAKGISLLVVDTAMAGFSKGRRLNKAGMKAQDTSELFFDNVRVPAANLLGEEGRGFACLMQELPWERLQIAIMAVTAAEAGLEWTLRRGDGAARVRGPLHRTDDGGTARRGHRVHGQAGRHRDAVQGAGPLRAAARRLRLYVGIPDHARLGRRARAARVRRHQRDYEGTYQS
jgi:alkylation response protein AidB-like acyl-CoA dehydrogenase